MRTENPHKIELQDFKEKLKICIVSAPYYKDITDNLIRGALNVLKKVKAETEIVECQVRLKYQLR